MRNALLLFAAAVLFGPAAPSASAQEQMEITSPSDGVLELSWWGRTGWTYFIQHSEDLRNWYYLPVMVAGEDELAVWGLSMDAPRHFFKLRGSDAPTNGDPEGADFDADGLTNLDELLLGLDPLRASSLGDDVPDGDRDGDVDGLTNSQEKAQGRLLDWKDHPVVELDAVAQSS